MAANTADLGRLVAAEISGVVADYGLTIPEFYIENISLPPSVEEALDKRTSMGLAGDLGRFARYSAAEAMSVAARTPDSAAGAGLGAGLGMGLGMGLARQLSDRQDPQAGMPPASAPVSPPPPPVEHVWHIAENGATHGPYSRATLGRMAGEGRFNRKTHVWTAGQDGWKRAGDVPELAQLFTVLPPPPPPGA